MKKTIKSILTLMLLLNLGLTIHISVTNAAALKVPSPQSTIEMIGNSEETGLPQFKFGQHPDAPSDYATPGLGSVISPIYFAIDLFRYLISGIALIVVIISSIKLVSVSNEEEATKIKGGLIFGIQGLLVVQIADIVVKKMFFGEQGEAFEDAATSQMFAEESVSQMRGIIGLVEFFLGAVAVLVIIIRAFTLITSPGDEESIDKAKTHILYALVGLAAIGLSEVVVRGVIFPDAGQSLPDVDKGKRILVMVTNYLSSFVAVISFIMLFYAGYRYVVAGSEEETGEKVKKTVAGAMIALLIALGAFAAVNTLVKLDAPQDTREVDLPDYK